MKKLFVYIVVAALSVVAVALLIPFAILRGLVKLANIITVAIEAVVEKFNNTSTKMLGSK